MNNNHEVKIIKGTQWVDERGTLCHFNEFNMESIKRMYVIEHPDTKIVRAWLAHKLESKWFMILSGGFKLIVVKPDNWANPSKNLDYTEILLKENKKEILHLPGGHAFGFKAIVPNSKMIVYSDFNIEDGIGDDYRFDKNLWYNW